MRVIRSACSALSLSATSFVFISGPPVKVRKTKKATAPPNEQEKRWLLDWLARPFREMRALYRTIIQIVNATPLSGLHQWRKVSQSRNNILRSLLADCQSFLGKKLL